MTKKDEIGRIVGMAGAFLTRKPAELTGGSGVEKVALTLRRYEQVT
jgi:hypothetical protein